MEKSAQPSEGGWTAHAHPLSLCLPSHTKLQCNALAERADTPPYFISTPICNLGSTVETLNSHFLSLHHFQVFLWKTKLTLHYSHFSKRKRCAKFIISPFIFSRLFDKFSAKGKYLRETVREYFWLFFYYFVSGNYFWPFNVIIITPIIRLLIIGHWAQVIEETVS